MGVRLAERVIANLPADTERVVLDADDTDDPCHGQQEFELFNGYYGEHCYKPLYIHLTAQDGRQWLLSRAASPWQLLRNKGAACGVAHYVKAFAIPLP